MRDFTAITLVERKRCKRLTYSRSSSSFLAINFLLQSQHFQLARKRDLSQKSTCDQVITSDRRASTGVGGVSKVVS